MFFDFKNKIKAVFYGKQQQNRCHGNTQNANGGQFAGGGYKLHNVILNVLLYVRHKILNERSLHLCPHIFKHRKGGENRQGNGNQRHHGNQCGIAELSCHTQNLCVFGAPAQIFKKKLAEFAEFCGVKLIRHFTTFKKMFTKQINLYKYLYSNLLPKREVV